MNEKHKHRSSIDRTRPYEHHDEDSIDIDRSAKDYPVMEHLSNARLMPMTGPYGRLDLQNTYEYGTVPKSPSTPLEPYDAVNKKNTERR